MSELKSLQASAQKCSTDHKFGGQMALNGVGLEQEERRDSVEGIKVEHAHHLQEGFQQ